MIRRSSGRLFYLPFILDIYRSCKIWRPCFHCDYIWRNLKTIYMNDLKELRVYVDSLVFLLRQVDEIDMHISVINRAKHGHGEETRQASLEVQDLERQKAKFIESINKVRAKI